jgi:hypothetical protein
VEASAAVISNFLHLGLDDNKPPIQMPGSSEYDTAGGVPDPAAAAGPRGPGPHDQIPPNKPPWFDQPHPVAPWGQQQVLEGHRVHPSAEGGAWEGSRVVGGGSSLSDHPSASG